MIKRSVVMGICAAFALIASNVMAVEKGDWLIRAGATNINPDSDNGDLYLWKLGPGLPTTAEADVDDAWGFTFNISYFLSNNIAIELLAAAPYDHDFEVKGTGITGSTKHLPPTLSVQYHFNPAGKFKPYIGAGINYTTFFDEDLNVGLNVELDDSWGLAGQVGVDMMFNEHWFGNVDVRYMSIKSDIEVAGVGIGTVDINPWLFGVSAGYRF